LGRVQDGIYKGFGLAGTQNEHGPILQGAFRGGLGTAEDEISHGATFQVCSLLDEHLLFFIEASVKAIRLRMANLSPTALNGMTHDCHLLAFSVR
jgi:hypothetical protein